MMKEHPLPVVPKDLINFDPGNSEEATARAQAVLDKLNTALAANDVKALEQCFHKPQAYWKDLLALTWHLRTFTGASTIAASLLELKTLRGLEGLVMMDGEARFSPPTPTLQFIDCSISFKTTKPAVRGTGKMALVPVQDGEKVEYKIWVLSKNPTLLQSPSTAPAGVEQFETDVLIMGGGNAGITLSARLKALGVDSLMLERNDNVGDNWALRYECMRFHVPTSACELPYLPYHKHLHTPHPLSGTDLAEHLQRYVATLNLNILTSARILSMAYNKSTKRWTVRFSTPAGQMTAVAKHLVQATGFCFQKPNMPPMVNEGIYKGINVHSAAFKNAASLKEAGVKSVLIIGSANTAFDILTDCVSLALSTTMLVRSPTYVVPLAYIFDARCLGAYDLPNTPTAHLDRRFLTNPTIVDAHMMRGALARLAAAEPSRYAALAARGFPVVDGLDPEACLAHYLLERGGGHCVDVGGTRLVVEGKVGVRVGVEPVGWMEKGVRLSDESVVEVDAGVWCTGFADKNARGMAAEVMGGEPKEGGEGVMGPLDIAARLDPTWGLDEEGEVRGMWKRHRFVENYWTVGGHAQHHRWHLRTAALQIKAELEGILLPAYRETPEVKKTEG
ncbi:putative indole-3-pyruvate monooxygenase YUCCA4 [Staphylotrichum tortipilum]|uniref:Indole-3-pyruvate monooxygenase YUCCA4 n=1 Tax=Staphylotrichum tortipilum TaxID=2831512 RepID=A0AAN6MA38_9PEZI|nr:putative indole-3-pyruvate monooxygenase YUCCA4 [Staphylotrichum longicolle]